jgi:predicted metal-binding protein
MRNLENITALKAAQLGLHAWKEIEPTRLQPDPRIRRYCEENRCGNYGKHYMCPPRIGRLPELKSRIAQYPTGFLLQYGAVLNPARDQEELRKSKQFFHDRILELEQHVLNAGAESVWGLIGGECALCAPCRAATDEPCPYPDRARPSLEALGVDVMSLLERVGLEHRFHDDRVIWTGCILFGPPRAGTCAPAGNLL